MTARRHAAAGVLEGSSERHHRVEGDYGGPKHAAHTDPNRGYHIGSGPSRHDIPTRPSTCNEERVLRREGMRVPALEGRPMLTTENSLDDWVRRDAQRAQGIIVDLVWRLVCASCPRPKERRFPLGDSIGQTGPDGFLDAEVAFDPFVPKGPSYWEIGTG